MGLRELKEWVTVVMHTYERPSFVERDVSEGRWSNIPLLIADDASSREVQERLQEIAREAQARFTAREVNGGAAEAARHGVESCGTPFFMLCGDDDYFLDFADFAQEAVETLHDPNVLFVSMPKIRFVIDEEEGITQFDRRIFDGMTGRELLRELVFGGEMRALQAGTMLRSAEAIPHFAGELFRTSEDFVLLSRMCAAYPDRRIRVLESGAYMRREHEASLSHTKNMSTERAVVNLLAVLVACRLLQRMVEVDDDIVLGLLRQRAQVLSTVYQAGLRSAEVLEALSTGKTPDVGTKEGEDALRFLIDRQAEIPAELPALKSAIGASTAPSGRLSPPQTLEAASEAFDAGDIARAQDLLMESRENDPETALGLLSLEARIAWEQGDAPRTVRCLTEALVINPEHADCLHMLVQIASAGGEESTAKRLENRLASVLPTDAAARLGVVTHQGVDDLRVAFLVSKGLDQFLDDIIRELLPLMDARKFVVTSRDDIVQAMEWAEVCWFEWCNDPVVWASRQDIARRKGLICRLHRYEAFSEMPKTVQWDHVDTLVVVAEHLGSLVTDLVPGLRGRTEIKHVPNGVDVSQYRFKQRKPGFDIALVGYLHGRKNPGLALQVLKLLVRDDSRYRLHVAGSFQDPALKLYWNHMVVTLGLAENVVMYDWQPGIASFLEDKDYLLSTSTHESFGYTIAEAMSCGIKPVVHNFPFAADMWPSEILFNTAQEAAQRIRAADYDSKSYRDHVLAKFTLQQQVRDIEEIIRSAAKINSGDTRPQDVVQTSALSPKRVNASLQCRCPACRSELHIQQQTIVGHPVARQRCPACSALIQIGPAEYKAALERCVAITHSNDFASHFADIERVAQTWASDPVWERVMTVDGVNLGLLMEVDMAPDLVRAWIKAKASQVKP